jgi:hypothetical protein
MREPEIKKKSKKKQEYNGMMGIKYHGMIVMMNPMKPGVDRTCLSARQVIPGE